MKNEELRNVRGSFDYGGKDSIIRSFISKILQETFEKYGYSPLETSILCYYDLLALKYDVENDILKEIYKVSDQGNRNLALRYDLTVPFAKYIASNQNMKLPYKRYEIGKVFKDGPIKKGRIREFNEIGLKENQIENLFKYLKMEFNELNKSFKNTLNLNLKDGLNELKELNEYISELNLTEYVKFSLTLARGQEYYTGTVFEVYVTNGNLKSSIGGGGRYDNMIGNFIKDGKKYPAVGISFGLDVIFEILKGKQTYLNNTDVFIIPMGNNFLALKIAEELRKNKINVDIEMTNLKLKKALNIVNRRNIPVAIIIGGNEIKENKIIIKDMKNNFQICEQMDTYIETIQDILSFGKIEYKIFNPGGNITALINGCDYDTNQKKLINRMIMEKYSQVEQVGFLSNKTNRLEMSGAEFCANAARCAVYEYLKENDNIIEISVSGTNKKIIGKRLNNNNVEIRLDIYKNITDLIEVKNNITYVKIDGILIVVFDEEKSKDYITKLRENEEIAKNEIKQLMIKEIQTEEKAIGIMLLEKVSSKIKINPVVWVKDIDTVFYETACGSGSLGTAIYNYYKNKDKKLELIQPSGYSINIDLDIKAQYIESASISGIVEEV